MPGVFALAAVGLLVARMPLVAALVFVLLTVLSAVALSILASRRSGGARSNGDHFGRAPYTTAVFAANSSFIAGSLQGAGSIEGRRAAGRLGAGLGQSEHA